MRFFLVFLSVLIFSSISFAQKSLRYSGDFYNGMRIKGEANYSYYLDENNNKIKNGSFRYSAREKTDTWRYSSSITGNFSKNLRHGKWVYVIESKDFEKSKEGYYYNISISLTANYNNGKPNGNWHFRTIKSQHKKEKRQNRWRNVGDTVIENVSIDLKWNNGVLVDSLGIIVHDVDEILAIMDSNGFMKSISKKSKESKISADYDDYILKSKTINNKKIINEEYAAYQVLKGDSELIKKKRRSLFYSNDCKIDNYIEKYIFLNPQFLNNYIDGDLTIRKDKNNKSKIVLIGLKYYEISPILTARENAIIKDINIKYANIKHADWMIKNELKKSPKDKKLITDQRRINNAISAYRTIECHIKEYKKFVSLQNTLTNSKCTEVKTSFDIKSKFDYLEALKTAADKQYKILEVNHQI